MLSVVVPIYNEEENIVAFHAAIEDVLNNIEEFTKESWEVIYVNDGSEDTSLALLLEIHNSDSRVAVVDLARNFGHQAALTAGLKTARGDAVILMDGDFQDPPEVLPRLVSAWKNGAKVIVAQRSSRVDKGIRGKLFPLFYQVLGWLSDFPVPLNAGIFGLLDRQAVDAINRMGESNRYLPGMRAWIGFPTSIVFYDRAGRAAGEAKQTVVRLIKYAMDAIFSFSYKPLRLGVALGGLILPFTLLLAFVRVAAGAFGHGVTNALSGFNTTFWTVLLLGSIQLICTGLLGEYIGRIYDEVRRRPLYLIHQLYKSEPGGKTMSAVAHEGQALVSETTQPQTNGLPDVGDLEVPANLSSLAPGP